MEDLKEINKNIDNENELVVSKENISTIIDIYKKYDNYTNAIKEKINNIANNYLLIGSNLVKVNESKAYECGNYKDIYEYGLNEFNLSNTSIKNLINIVKRFCKDISSYEISLKDEYRNYSYSQLVEFASLNNEEIKEFNPLMSVRQIRSNKYKLIVKEYAEKEFSKEYSNNINLLIDNLSNMTFNNGYKISICGKPKISFNDGLNNIEEIIIFKLSSQEKKSEELKLFLIFTYSYSFNCFDIIFKDTIKDWNYETIYKKNGFYIVEDNESIVDNTNNYIKKMNIKIKTEEKNKKKEETIKNLLNKPLKYEEAISLIQYDSTIKEIKMFLDIFSISLEEEKIIVVDKWHNYRIILDDNFRIFKSYNSIQIFDNQEKMIDEISYDKFFCYLLKNNNSVDLFKNLIEKVKNI